LKIKKVVHVNHADIEGGAARAAYRIHKSICSNEQACGFRSEMLVVKKYLEDPTIKCLTEGAIAIHDYPSHFLQVCRSKLVYRRLKNFVTTNPSWHSFCVKPTKHVSSINTAQADIANLHWIGDSVCSIEELGKLTKPLVWTLHDQWAFCGAEHYTNLPPDEDDRYTQGYLTSNRPRSESGYDLNRQVWLRKKKYWRRSINIVCPSRWLADCARRSELMRSWPITVIPNPIDVAVWSPKNKRQCREIRNLDYQKKYLLFGAVGGTKDPRKGGLLLIEALNKLKATLGDLKSEQIELLVFGQTGPGEGGPFPFKTHYFGNVTDDAELAGIYSASDIMLIPSRLDNLPNTGLEAHACGTPVVGYDVGGLCDIVSNGQTGFLAKSFDTSEYAAKINELIENTTLREQCSFNARERAIKLWRPTRIAGMYAELYNSILND
jgi:glycosyltransferase involved in cell wall biosynthesis